MFVLAHLSDPHLAPLPRPRPRELLSKRGLGYINWLRKRRSIHRADMLAALVADLKGHAPDHVAVTGDLVNLSLTNEFAPARDWLARLGRSARRHGGARQSRCLCAASRRFRGTPLGRLHARRRRRELSLRAAARAAGADRPFDLAADAAARRDRAPARRPARAPRRTPGEAQARADVPRRPDPSSAGRRRELFSPADQCRRAPRRAARARRRARAARPSP